MKLPYLAHGGWLLVLCLLTGCASFSGHKNIQPQINALVVADRFDNAIALLEQGPAAYGPHNEMLYWLDKGMALHLAGQYQQSTTAFLHARKLVDVLYGQSSFEIASSLLVNDTKREYRAEEYEIILINIFQALNYALLGNIDEALVEARDVDKQLKLIGARYPQELAQVYRDDAFVWVLMGLLWEIEGSTQSKNDALIAYKRAMAVYQGDYASNYGIQPPAFLQDNYERLNQWMQGHGQQQKGIAEVYVIQYTGYVPIKVAKSFVLPLGLTRMTKVSLPDYEQRLDDVQGSQVIAQTEGITQHQPTDIVQPIGSMAAMIMKNRMAWLTAKGMIRPAAKMAAEYAIENEVRRRYGNWQADVTAIIGSLYNMISEEADTRSWQTLPHDIRMARLRLSPGHWKISVKNTDGQGQQLNEKAVADIDLKEGQKVILVTSR